MKIVIFGLTISSSWGNGHATLWRGLCRALHQRNHDVVFFERDVPYYAAHRDAWDFDGVTLRLYSDWPDVLGAAASELESADVALITSYCPDALAAGEIVLASNAGVRGFYDLDAPVTLDRMQKGEQVPYIGPRGLVDFDLVLSYTGGQALDRLRNHLGAQRVEPLYGSVDPQSHFPVQPREQFRGDLSYLGTYSGDRQAALAELFIEPARRLPAQRFVIGGAMYPQEFPWTPNIFFVRHLPPADHPAFFCSSRLTLNVTRHAMAEMGYCPSGRLFEAAACGAPILSDWWESLDSFFTPNREILVARTAEDTIAALALSDAELQQIAQAARERTLDQHSAERRAAEFEHIIESEIGGHQSQQPNNDAPVPSAVMEV